MHATFCINHACLILENRCNYLSTHLPTDLPISSSMYLISALNFSIYLIYPCTYLPADVSTRSCLPFKLSTYLPIYPATHLPIYLSVYLLVSIDLFILPSIYVPTCLSIYLPAYQSDYAYTYRLTHRFFGVLSVNMCLQGSASETSLGCTSLGVMGSSVLGSGLVCCGLGFRVLTVGLACPFLRIKDV